ncbi:hypothetical protein [Streptomyces sp. NPDC093105]|uniref:hypothetical protein n=1 Tax=Streptomyces sp. NPDC093105 TaxID=3366029 RepID=UPI003808B57F
MVGSVLGDGRVGDGGAALAEEAGGAGADGEQRRRAQDEGAGAEQEDPSDAVES